MKWFWRKDRQGQPYRSFLIYDSEKKKNRRLRKSEVPSNIVTDKNADEFVAELKAKFKSAQYRAEQRVKYKKQFHDFQNLADIFESEMKKRAPIDWPNSVRDLEYFVFEFFLNIKGVNNVNDWYLHYSEFKDWLNDKATSVKGNKSISYSQKNSVISSLNSFIGILVARNKIQPTTPKCLRFPQKLIERRSVEHVLSPDEIKDLISKLRELDPDIGDFIYLCLHVGARFAEMLGLSIQDYQEGIPNDKIIQDILKQHNLNCFGYFAFNSQVSDPSKPRDSNGLVNRKPLKHRAKIEVSDFRIVPVLDETAHNIVADRYERCLESFNSTRYGTNPENYLLFEGLTEARVNKALKLAYSALRKYKPKTVHCLRHTFATNLAGKVSSDHRIFQLTMGHRDQKTTAGYNHIYQAVSRNLATQRTIKMGGIKKVEKKS